MFQYQHKNSFWQLIPELQNTYQSKQLEDLPIASVGSGVINLSLLDAGVVPAAASDSEPDLRFRASGHAITTSPWKVWTTTTKASLGPCFSFPMTQSTSSPCCRISSHQSLVTPRAGSSTRQSNRTPIIFMVGCANISRTAT